MDARPVISVVIPHLNTPTMLARCLRSIFAQDLPSGEFEVIVVDNGSQVLLDHVWAAFPQVRHFVERMPGPGPARNAGVAAARADCLAFIDADCVARPGWLAAAHAAAAAHRIVGGEIVLETLDPRRLTGIEAFESVFSFRQRMYIHDRQFSVTANLAMPRSAFDRVGPFGGIDIAEDLDWGRRAHHLGLTMDFCPDMQVTHPPQADMPALQRKFDRLDTHLWNEHLALGRTRWRWWTRTLAMALSPLVDAPRLLTSSRLAGTGNRMRGVATLVSIRWYRARRMVQRAAAPPAPSMQWNR